jgi:hypothetical protein
MQCISPENPFGNMEGGDMRALRIIDHRRLSFVAIATIALIVVSACNSQNDPFDVGERAAARSITPTVMPTTAPSRTAPTPVPGTPTPLSTLEPVAAVGTVQAREVEHLASLFEPSVGAVKFAEWEDKPLKFANALLGYILVYGYDFTVELVPIEGDSYQDAFQSGELDILLAFDKNADGDWYTTHIEGKGIADLGSLRDGNGDQRLVVHSGLSEREPEVTEFLAKAKPTDELIDKLSATIREGGRIAIKPTVPAIKFLKEQEALWTQWVPASVADKVRAAIAAGKTSLVNRKCIPDGGSGGGSNNCGT